LAQDSASGAQVKLRFATYGGETLQPKFSYCQKFQQYDAKMGAMGAERTILCLSRMCQIAASQRKAFDQRIRGT
jgi:hypothetical protein